ncbi:hypothetical protein [Corynebacterium gottingense]|uniref:hypothetical protein n=1 Tax=Corynebacterium gottingense TaxID=2041036 RepID=UPI0039EC7AFB
MAHTPRRRALVAASALSLALTAPSIVVPNGYAQDTTTTETTATSATSVPDSAVDWEKEYDANFAGNEPATVEGLVLPEGSTIEAAAATLFNWKLAANGDGSVELTRPQSDVAFRDGLQSIPAKVTLPGEEPQNVTLKVNVFKNDAAWVADLPDLGSPYDVDFEGKLSKTVDEITLPEGVTVKKGTGKPLWGVSTKDGKVLITAPSNFVAGTQDLPVEFSDGTTTVKRTLKINASNPQTSSGEVAGIAGDVLGKILGGIVGGATGGGLLGGLTGGGSGSGTGSGSGDGKGGGVNINIASNNGNPSVVITDNAKAEIKDNLANNGNPVITDNAKAEIKDNLSNNGNPDVKISDNAKATVVITDNANPHDNLSNNGNPDVKISDNAKATVDVKVTDNAKAEIKDNANPRDNLSNNGNPDVKISDNAKATVDVKVTDNAKAEIKDNANNNGNPDVKISDNAKADIKDNAKATVVITDNANPRDNLSNNGNPDVKISDNAKATVDVKVTDNAKADVNVTDNGNPDVKVTDNGKVDGIPASSGGGSSAFGQEGEGPEVGANVGVEGGSSDPRCAATLAGLAVPILAIIPLALATQLTVPGLESVGAQLTRTLNDAARNFGVQPEALTAAGAGVIGLATAVLAIVGARTCVPSVRDVDITVGSSGSGETPSTTSTVAPVVKTD